VEEDDVANLQEFEIETVCDTNKVAEYLETLAQRIREGNVMLSAGDEDIQIRVGQRAKLELEAKSNPDEGETTLEFEVTWKEQMEEEEQEVPITIGSGP
jgi:amphi-Trp domain-containing protein